MKHLLTLFALVFLFACEKEVTEQIEGDWYYTRVVCHYNDGKPYYSVDYSWDDAQYTNTETTVHIGNDPTAYTEVDHNTINITTINRVAEIEFLDSPRDGFDLSVIGDDDTTIEKLTYSYRRKK